MMPSSESQVQPFNVDVAQSGPQPLQLRNWANLGAYVVNMIFTVLSLVGVIGESNPNLSKKYQTLITPATGAFSIWSFIFLGELVFAVAQMMPSFRSSKLVEAICPWWVAACIFQSSWYVCFALEYLIVAEVLIAAVLLSLLGLLYAADRVGSSTMIEYWLLLAPFSVHAGWVLAANAVSFNVTLDGYKAEPPVMLATAAVSLAVVFAAVALLAVVPQRPDAFLPLVGAWATYWISQELANPDRLMAEGRFNFYKWSDTTVAGLQMAAQILSLACLGLAALALGLRMLRTQQGHLQAKGEEAASVPPLAAGA